MKQIRHHVFETNSSSTHSIAIPKNDVRPNYISFNVDEFGWSFNEVDAANYFYTAIYETSDTKEEVNEKIEKLKDILDAYDVEYDLKEARAHTWHSDYSNNDYFSLDDGYIDHGYALREFVDELINNGDKLMRFLGGGLVFTGNDNADAEERCFIERDQEFLDDYDWRTRESFKIKNPYYMENHEDYEWYWKGN